MSLDLSVVIPVYNEANNLSQLHGELHATLEKLDKSYEIIFVDDGSTDGSFQTLEQLQKEFPKIKVLKFDRNYGQHPALSAGFEVAQGKTIVIMDADGQNDPADIPNFLKKIDEGYSMVWGRREKRKDPFFTRKIPSYIFNKIICKFTGVNVQDINCGIKAFTGKVAQAINTFGEKRSFLPVFLASISPSIVEISVNHRERFGGRSKYPFFKSCEIIFSFLTSYSVRTFRLIGIIGLFMTIFGLSSSGLYVVLYYLAGIFIEKLGAILSLSILLGIQFFIIGMIGELLHRIYGISNKQPLFVVEEVLENKNES